MPELYQPFKALQASCASIAQSERLDVDHWHAAAIRCQSLDSGGQPLPLKLDYLTLIADSLDSDSVQEQLTLHRLHLTPRKAKFGYQRGVSVHLQEFCLDDPVFEVFWGGDSQRGTMMFDRSGPLSALAAGILCRIFGAEQFRLSRADVALDLQYPDCYREVKSFLDQQFSDWHIGGRGGQKPAYREISDCGTGKGCTTYLGSGDVHMLRAYEKGKQLQRLDALDWVRVEVQLRPGKRPAQFLAWSAVAAGRFFQIWQMTPYVRFSDYFLCQQAGRIMAEQPSRDSALEAKAKHLVTQYYGVMQQLVGLHAHGDWSELGNIIQRVKGALDAGSGSTWHVEQALLDQSTGQTLVEFSDSDGSHNLYYVKLTIRIKTTKTAPATTKSPARRGSIICGAHAMKRRVFSPRTNFAWTNGTGSVVMFTSDDKATARRIRA
ncbi:replication initiation factor domain-containing protein [Chromobacterium subtsugae]|uniref:replication initiation factor domain-containing protein n=1 Tax=Chromobacterium subtsugae TaxID=251747 RepID=UPI0007F912A1|nr:replication initiation factor domain-containing protein [Chromobacterium subtsugae]OBU86847.1 hypothetical protein MY55_08585 [Chromobacterium subtsugae]